MAQVAPVGHSVLIFEASLSHTETPRSEGLLWRSNQLVAEICTWQHTTITRDRHPYSRRDSNPQSQQASSCMPTTLKRIRECLGLNEKSIRNWRGWHETAGVGCPARHWPVIPCSM